MQHSKPAAGSAFPLPLSWPRAGGGRVEPASGDGWRLLVIYRGRHCGKCRQYLDGLQRLLPDFERAGICVMAVSADPLDKAQAQVSERGWTFPVGCELPLADMRRLGLYVSPPQPGKTDREFAEPALFAINPNGAIHVACIGNAPFARPDLREVLEGLKTAIEEHAPVHGTA